MKIKFSKYNPDTTNSNFVSNLLLKYVKENKTYPKNLLKENIDLKIEKYENTIKELSVKLSEVNKQMKQIQTDINSYKVNNRNIYQNLIKNL